jgi:hypothetical protein
MASVLWAMDIDSYTNTPVSAHRVVADGEGTEQRVKITACGLRLTEVNHPRGWWTMPEGELPLQSQHVHCGGD